MQEKDINISHGVKNILQAMKGARDIVDSSLENEDIDRARRGWSMLGQNLDRIEKLVMDVLKLSRDEKCEFTKCDFNEIVRQAVENLNIEAKRQNKAVSFVIDEAVGLVECDEDMVYDIVLNLLINALYEVAEDTGQVSVSTSLDTENSMVVLRVCDNGPGIEDIETVFEPFKTSKPKLGSGLGLSIVKKNVAMHSGKIKLENAGENGAVFLVQMPVRR